MKRLIWLLLVVPVMAQTRSQHPRLRATATACTLPGGTTHEVLFGWTTPQAGTTALFLATGACPASGTPTGSQVSSSTALSGCFADTAVTAATTYCGYATVTGVSTPSNTVQVQIPVFPPAKLTGSLSGTTETLTWTASPDAGTVNVLESSGACGSGTFTTYGTGAPAGGPFTMTGLTPRTYCVEVQAVVGGVTSPVSNTFQFQVATAANPPVVTITAQ
jgi:hypothetical protein